MNRDEGSYTLSHTQTDFLPRHITTVARTEQASSDKGYDMMQCTVWAKKRTVF